VTLVLDTAAPESGIMLKAIVLLCVVGAALGLQRPRGTGERIIGGQQAARGQFPYQAQIQYLNGHQCGASIINEHWVVTAGHCVTGLAISYTIVANQYDILSAEGMERRQVGQRIVRHPQYSGDPIRNDIALVRVANPLYTPGETVVTPIRLPRQGQNSTVGSDSTVSGWGVTAEGGILPRYLRFVEVPVVDDAECKSAYQDQLIEDQMICAGFRDGGKDACNGDSGGPMVCEDAAGDAYLCGIVSWGLGCARPYYYGVYTEVAAFTNWIENNID